MRHDRHDGQSRHNSRLTLIRGLAETQGGHVRRDQLHQLGLTDHAIAHMIKRGFLIRVHRGVYAVAVLHSAPLDRAHGALLAVGDGSVLSFEPAGSLWGVYPRWYQRLEVSTPYERSPKGITVHHCVTIRAVDIFTDPVSGIRVTSAARTALDLTPRMTDERATRMVNDLRVRRKLTLPAARSVLEANRRHRGAARWTAILLGSQREPTRSDLEDVYMGIVTRFDLPVPEINQHTGGERVDFRYRAGGDDERVRRDLIVEVDGYGAHSNPRQFAEDRRRDRDILIATGIPTIRFTFDDCVETPETVAQTVLRAVAGPGTADGAVPR